MANRATSSAAKKAKFAEPAASAAKRRTDVHDEEEEEDDLDEDDEMSQDNGEEGEEEEELQDFECWADQAIFIRMVHSKQEAEADEAGDFHPEFTHQVIGESEKIVGYDGLRISLYYGAGSLLTLLQKEAKEVADPEELGAPPDKPLAKIKEWIPAGYLTSLDKFAKEVEKAEREFQPPGKECYSYRRNKDSFAVFASSPKTPGLKEYHARAQTFAIWYIEAANFIDFEDDNWRFLHLYKSIKDKQGKQTWALVGFVTIYLYYAYPEHLRPRISQMVILPPYQRQGHGAQLLQAAYKYCAAMNNVVDVPVEDPSPAFRALRDYVDCKNALPLSQDVDFAQPDPTSWQKLLQEKLKIPKAQARRIYEILFLRSVAKKDPSAKRAFVAFVKKRLLQPHVKTPEVEARMLAVMNDEEKEQYHKMQQEARSGVDKEFQVLCDEYLAVIERLASPEKA